MPCTVWGSCELCALIPTALLSQCSPTPSTTLKICCCEQSHPFGWWRSASSSWNGSAQQWLSTRNCTASTNDSIKFISSPTMLKCWWMHHNSFSTPTVLLLHSTFAFLYSYFCSRFPRLYNTVSLSILSINFLFFFQIKDLKIAFYHHRNKAEPSIHILSSRQPK